MINEFFKNLEPIVDKLSEIQQDRDVRVNRYVKQKTSWLKKELAHIDYPEREAFIKQQISEQELALIEKRRAFQHTAIEALTKSNLELRHILEHHQGIQYIKPLPTTESKTTHSFVYLNNREFTDCLKSLHNNLSKEGYIDSPFGNLSSIFQKEKVNKKVNWIASKRSLKYFVDKLCQKESVQCKNKWVCASNCFTIVGQSIDILGKEKLPSDSEVQKINSILSKF
ncbi:MAG: hypothetical protein H8E12_04240 [Rhodobacteraceae bacterium]|nr:hypothetical protein [Paracoccaceae bacterium]